MTHFQAVWEDGIEVRWRSLTWAEYRRFQQRASERPAAVFLDLYRALLLSGPSPETVPAGIVDYIGRQQLTDNPFAGYYKDVKSSLDRSRKELEKNFLLSARAVVSSLFHYSFEEIDEWDHETFFLRLAQAEMVAGRPLEPAAPEGKKKPQPIRSTPTLTPAQESVRQRVKARERSQ